MNVRLQNLINEAEEATNSFLTEGSFFRLFSYLQLAIFRMRGDCYIKEYHYDKESEFIAHLINYVFQYFDIERSEEEVQYLNSFSKIIRFYKKDIQNTSMIKIQTITRKFIENISDDLAQPFYKDYNFFVNLSNHLERIFSENFTGGAVYPEVELIIESNLDIVESVKRNIGILEKFIGRKISKEEISYIVIYICASKEKLLTQYSGNTVVLVCNSGIGTSYLMKSKILEHFNFIIKDVYSSHNLSLEKLEDVDFIISTVDLQAIEFPYVKISPLLTDEDYLKVRSMINKVGKGYLKPAESTEMLELIHQIKPIIHEYQGLDEDILKVIHTYFRERETKELLLEDFLIEEYIEIDVEVKDWKEAIEKASYKLLEKEYFTKNYLDSMIRNVEANGPYIVISQGFALPHAGIKDGTKKVGFNLIRLKKPVCFNAGLLDPIKYICVLSAVDNKTHLKAFFNLVNLLKIKEFHKRMDAAASAKELADVIRKYERNLNIGGV